METPQFSYWAQISGDYAKIVDSTDMTKCLLVSLSKGKHLDRGDQY